MAHPISQSMGVPPPPPPELNIDERVWVCFEMVRVQNAHAVQILWPKCWPGRRVPTIHAILKNYRKYMQHGTSLNRNKVHSGRYL